MTHLHAMVLQYIMDNPNCKRRDVAIALDISQRELRAIVSDLIRNGEPVLCGNEGYIYSQDPETINRVARRYDAMGVNNLANARALHATAKKIQEAKEQLPIQPIIN
jgi:hypothetical protein